LAELFSMTTDDKLPVKVFIGKHRKKP